MIELNWLPSISVFPSFWDQYPPSTVWAEPARTNVMKYTSVWCYYLPAAYTQIIFSKFVCVCVFIVTSDWIFRDSLPGSKVSGVKVISWLAVWGSCQGCLHHLSINRSSASCSGSVSPSPLAVMISPLTRPLVSLLCRATVSTFRLVNTDLHKQTWPPETGQWQTEKIR